MGLKVAVASLFLMSACTVGEVGGGGNTPPVDAPSQTIDAPSGNGGIDAPPTQGGDPEAVFTSDVKPLIAAKGCANAGCHGAGNGTGLELTSYDTLLASKSGAYTANPGSANILVKKATAGSSEHYGVTWFSAAEVTKVAAWIDIAGPN